MESSGKPWLGLAGLLVTAAGVIGTWLTVPGFRDFFRLGPPPPSVHAIQSSELKTKTTSPEPPAKSEQPTTQVPSNRTSQDERQAGNNSSGPVLSRQIDDFFLKMTECTPTGDRAAQDLAIHCVGSIENQADFKIRVEFYDGRAIDDNGNVYRIWTTGPWGGVVANFYFGAGCCAEELIPGVPVKFGFPLDHVKRDATSLSVVLNIIFPRSSGGWSRREAVFKGVPIRGH